VSVSAGHAAQRAAALRRAEAIADGWPLTTSYDLSSRLAAGGDRVTGWAIHQRCGQPGCGQSVLSASNDSGAYVWSIAGELRPSLLAHIMQCHRQAVDDFAERMKNAPQWCDVEREIHVAAGDGRCECRRWKI
jgi:hypothetical protein